MSPRAGKRTSKARPRGSANSTGDSPARSGVESATYGNVEIEPEEIARLAYYYWEARGGQGGSPEEDWLRAEQQLRIGNQR
jgi:hypothetical protein